MSRKKRKPVVNFDQARDEIARLVKQFCTDRELYQCQIARPVPSGADCTGLTEDEIIVAIHHDLGMLILAVEQSGDVVAVLST